MLKRPALLLHGLGVFVEAIGIGGGTALAIGVQGEQRDAELALQISYSLGKALGRHGNVRRRNAEILRFVGKNEIIDAILKHKPSLARNARSLRLFYTSDPIRDETHSFTEQTIGSKEIRSPRRFPWA